MYRIYDPIEEEFLDETYFYLEEAKVALQRLMDDPDEGGNEFKLYLQIPVD